MDQETVDIRLTQLEEIARRLIAFGAATDLHAVTRERVLDIALPSMGKLADELRVMAGDLNFAAEVLRGELSA